VELGHVALGVFVGVALYKGFFIEILHGLLQIPHLLLGQQSLLRQFMLLHIIVILLPLHSNQMSNQIPPNLFSSLVQLSLLAFDDGIGPIFGGLRFVVGLFEQLGDCGKVGVVFLCLEGLEIGELGFEVLLGR
jgi:hypothetical protein